MFFRDNKNQDSEKDNLIKIAALLIHTAKIDEDFSKQEGEIIKQALLKLGTNKQKQFNNVTIILRYNYVYQV